MSRLRPFSLDIRVTAEEARQDGISLDCGDWFVQGIGSSVGAFVDFLGPRPSDPVGEEGINAWSNILLSTRFSPAQLSKEFFGWMFARPAGNLDQHTEMNIQAGGSGSVPRPGAPLAKGKLNFLRPQSGDEDLPPDSTRRRLLLNLFLNPTRYVRHQHLPPSLRTAPSTWQLGEPNLRTRQIPRRRQTTNEPSDADIETSLDGNDNVLIGPAMLSFARPAAWPMHLRRYIEAVDAALDAEFTRAYHSAGLHHQSRQPRPARLPYYSLKRVETYFEFSAENPVQLLRRIRPALERIGTSFRTREYPLGLAECVMDGNALRVQIILSAGCQLRVYAKTNRRLRFEILHDMDSAAVCRLLHAEGGGHTTHNREELLGWFRLLAQDAASQLNRVLSIIEEQTQIPVDSADTYDLYSEVFATVRNCTRARDLVRLIVEQESLRVGRRGSDFLPEIKQLVRKGVIKKVGGGYQVTPRFRQAVSILREQAGLPVLSDIEND